MRLPPESSSSWVLIGFAAYTWASFKAWSEFPDLPENDRDFLAEQASSLRTHVDSLMKEARETQDQVIFYRPEAQASQNAWLTLLRRVTFEALSMVAIRLGQGSKESKPVREFLPNLLATVVKKPLAERPAIAARAAERLAQLTGDFAEKATLAARLTAAANGAQAAVDANGSSFNAWSKERSEEVVAKGRLRLELERTHRAVGAHFAGQREFVESFFLKGEKPSEGETEDETPAETAPAQAAPAQAAPAQAAPAEVAQAPAAPAQPAPAQPAPAQAPQAEAAPAQAAPADAQPAQAQPAQA